MTPFQFQTLMAILKVTFYVSSGELIRQKRSEGFLIKVASYLIFLASDLYLFWILFNPVTIGNFIVTLVATIQGTYTYFCWRNDERGKGE